jgi:CheY-like chemotaxis protein
MARVLVVGLEKSHYDQLLPLLSRALLNVERLAAAEGAAQLARRVKWDLLIVRYPLPDMSIGSFMQSVHESGSESAATPILVIADDNRTAEIGGMLPGGAKQVVSVNQPAKIVAEVSSRLKLAPRVEARIAVRIDVRLAGVPPLMCQSENVSEHGLLVRTDARYPIGTRAGFEISLPGEPKPVAGDAEIVRHAEPAVEGMKGMGLKILLWKGDGATRVRRFVSKR